MMDIQLSLFLLSVIASLFVCHKILVISLNALVILSDLRKMTSVLQRLDAFGFWENFQFFLQRVNQSHPLTVVWKAISKNLMIPSKYATLTVIRSTTPLLESIQRTGPSRLTVEILNRKSDIKTALISLLVPLSFYILLQQGLIGKQGHDNQRLMMMALASLSILGTILLTTRVLAQSAISREVLSLTKVFERVLPYISIQHTTLLLLNETRESLKVLQDLAERVPNDRFSKKESPKNNEKTIILGARRASKTDDLYKHRLALHSTLRGIDRS